MKLLPRWGMMAVIFSLAIVFFGSVICPPIEEREAETEYSMVHYPLQADPGTYKALPGSLQIEDRFPIEDRPPPLPDDVFSSIEVTVLDHRGDPIAGAQVAFMFRRESGYAKRAWGFTDSSGKFVSSPLFRETYQVEVQANNYFPVITDRIALPTQKQSKVEVRMALASRLSGTIVTAHGSSAVHGFLSFTDLGTGDVVKGSIAPDGSFRSPPLDAGNWRLAWVERPTALVDPALSYAVPLDPGQQRNFRIVIPGKVLTESTKYAVGIQEVLP